MFTLHAGGWNSREADLLALDLDDTLLDHTRAAGVAATALSAVLSLQRDDAAQVWLAAEDRHFPRFERGECSWQEQRRARMRDFASPDLTDEEVDAYFGLYLTQYEAAWRRFPDAKRLLNRLHQAQISVAVLTNGQGEQQHRKLTAMGWDYPSQLVASADVGFAKPSEDYFLAVEEETGVPSSRIVMVGNDAARDFDGAVNAGCQAIHLDRHSAFIRAPRVQSFEDLELRLT